MRNKKIAELLHEYFELGVAEGREGRNHDTEAGDAQRVLSEIEAEIAALSAAEPVSSIVPDHCSGTALIFEGGCLHVRKDGSGHIVVDEDDFKLEDDRCEGEHGSEGSVHWIARFPAGEMTALRNFLNGQDFPASPAASSASPQCCMCGKNGLSTAEGDGGTECELSDGRWVCSSECWDRAVEPAPSVAVKAEEFARQLWGYFKGDSTGGTTAMQWFDNHKSLSGPARLIELCRSALSAQVQDVASSGGMEFPEALTDDLRDVLSTMLWTSGQIAACLRAGGDQIKTRAEDEQAHVLHWLISLALKHGTEWRAKASERIKAIRDAAAPTKQEG